eukprot:6072731-Prymnesium_polylepis.1
MNWSTPESESRLTKTPTKVYAAFVHATRLQLSFGAEAFLAPLLLRSFSRTAAPPVDARTLIRLRSAAASFERAPMRTRMRSLLQWFCLLRESLSACCALLAVTIWEASCAAPSRNASSCAARSARASADPRANSRSTPWPAWRCDGRGEMSRGRVIASGTTSGTASSTAHRAGATGPPPAQTRRPGRGNADLGLLRVCGAAVACKFGPPARAPAAFGRRVPRRILALNAHGHQGIIHRDSSGRRGGVESACVVEAALVAGAGARVLIVAGWAAVDRDVPAWTAASPDCRPVLTRQPHARYYGRSGPPKRLIDP